jgi:signal-transduction protein with cAMP-binding, CBS, and nucleotidyltransferase domain
MRHMPVVRDGQVIGIVSMRDLLAVEVWAGPLNVAHRCS